MNLDFIFGFFTVKYWFNVAFQMKKILLDTIHIMHGLAKVYVINPENKFLTIQRS